MDNSKRKMDTFHELIDAVDEIKEDITDQKYKHLVETIGKLNEKKDRYVLVKYIHSRIEYEYNSRIDEEEAQLKSTQEEKIIKITETRNEKRGITFLWKDMFEEWKKSKIWRVACESEHLILVDYEDL